MQYLLYIDLCGTKFQARRQKLNSDSFIARAQKTKDKLTENSVLTGYLLDM